MNLNLGTTSYIYPVEENNLLYNVKELSTEFDFIQLLCFGKDYIDEIINDDILKALADLYETQKIDFILHLPLDLNLLSDNKLEKQKMLNLVKDLISKTEKYIPIKYYVMHMDKCINFKYPEIILNQDCRKNFTESIDLIQKILKSHTNKICIENTSYDLTFFEKELKSTDLKICLDIGHIYISDNSLNSFLATFDQKIRVIHLHGVDNDKDHLCLSKMTDARLTETFTYLQTLDSSHITILEVFNRENLDGSLKILQEFNSEKASSF